MARRHRFLGYYDSVLDGLWHSPPRDTRPYSQALNRIWGDPTQETDASTLRGSDAGMSWEPSQAELGDMRPALRRGGALAELPELVGDTAVGGAAAVVPSEPIIIESDDDNGGCGDTMAATQVVEWPTHVSTTVGGDSGGAPSAGAPSAVNEDDDDSFTATQRDASPAPASPTAVLGDVWTDAPRSPPSPAPMRPLQRIALVSRPPAGDHVALGVVATSCGPDPRVAAARHVAGLAPCSKHANSASTSRDRSRSPSDHPWHRHFCIWWLCVPADPDDNNDTDEWQRASDQLEVILQRDMAICMKSPAKKLTLCDCERFRESLRDYGADPQVQLFAVPLTRMCAWKVAGTDLCVPFMRFGAYGSLDLREPFPIRQTAGRALEEILKRIMEVTHIEENLRKPYYIGFATCAPRRALEHQSDGRWQYHVLYYHPSKERCLTMEAAAISHHRGVHARCANKRPGGEGDALVEYSGPYFVYLAL